VGGSTTKKVHITRFDREALTGFVNPQTYLTPHGVELLSLKGSVSTVNYDEIKAVTFVRDLEETDNLEGRLFTTRPKMEGLWVRMQFRDGEWMDGVLPNNLLSLDLFGFTIIPPDPSPNRQRVFVPKAALSRIQVAGVVGSPVRSRGGRPKP
jgi:hypothetical protein